MQSNEVIQSDLPHFSWEIYQVSLCHVYRQEDMVVGSDWDLWSLAMAPLSARTVTISTLLISLARCKGGDSRFGSIVQENFHNLMLLLSISFDSMELLCWHHFCLKLSPFRLCSAMWHKEVGSQKMGNLFVQKFCNFYCSNFKGRM